MAQIQSLAQELPCAAGVAIKKKKEEECFHMHALFAWLHLN